MNYFLSGFCLTLISSIFWYSVPDIVWVLWLLLFGFATLKFLPILSGGLLAVAYFCWYLSCLFDATDPILASNLPQKSITKKTKSLPVILRGEVVSLTRKKGNWLSADIKILASENHWQPDAYMRLSWPSPPDVKIGEMWHFRLKPKSITSVMNQGGFNQQRYLLSHHIIAKGRVIKAEKILYQPSFRQRFLADFSSVAAKLPDGDLVAALLLGDKSRISSDRWQQLRQSGTGHLVAISGLHLSVISIWLYFSVLFLLSRFLPCQGRRNMLLALAASCLGALGYACLAGFALPTQRALIMLLMVLLLSVFRRYASPWERLLYALSLVLLLDPLAVLSSGFWLSFGALTMILMSLSSAQTNALLDSKNSSSSQLYSYIKLFFILQLKLAIGLGALQAFLFDTVSLHSFWFNLLMVPWFSLVVIPLTLLAGVCWFLLELIGFAGTEQIFYLSQWSLNPFVYLLELTDHLPGSQLGLSTDWKLALLGLLCLLPLVHLIAFKLSNWRWLLILPLMPLLVLSLQKLAQKSLPMILPDKAQTLTKYSPWQLHLLDVGQGLSLVISRYGRAFLYDTGASYGNFSYAERNIVPFLMAKGITGLDYLIVSHGDNDHAGGVNAIRKAFSSVKVISDVVADAAIKCRPQTIYWQQLRLEFLSPKQPQSGNDGSCVLRVSDGNHSVLLTGDIEARAENALVASGKQLKSSILVVPHHGSRTSSTVDFIDAVNPQLALFAAGWRNRYGFPKTDILARYHQRGISTATTGELGQISINIDPETGWQMLSYRNSIAPFWYNQLFEFGTNTKAE